MRACPRERPDGPGRAPHLALHLLQRAASAPRSLSAVRQAALAMGNQIMTVPGAITCPHCRVRTAEPMPTNACLRLFECPGCHAVLQPRSGDCCVFCSYGDDPCPPRQHPDPSGYS